jgi:hypothetical protein
LIGVKLAGRVPGAADGKRKNQRRQEHDREASSWGVHV